MFFNKYTLLISLLIPGVIFKFSEPLLEIWEPVKNILHNWQDFFGALIGASVAILVFLLAEWNKSKQEHKNHIHLLHRSVGAALDNLREIDITITDFAQEQLEAMIRNTDADIANSRPTICYGFVPLLHVFDISEELLRKTSGSGYVDILTIFVINRSKSFRRIIDDINRQFESTISMNNQLVFSGINQNYLLQSQSFKQNLHQFRSKMLHTDFQLNIREYASLLIKVQVSLEKLGEWKIKKWKKTFKHLEPNNVTEGIDAYFANEIEKKKIKYRPVFRTKL